MTKMDETQFTYFNKIKFVVDLDENDLEGIKKGMVFDGYKKKGSSKIWINYNESMIYLYDEEWELCKPYKVIKKVVL